MRRVQNDTSSTSRATRNLATNPEFVAGTTDKVLNTNLLKNPSFRTTAPAFDLWRNYAFNPAMVTTSGTTTVRTNVHTNPSFEASNGTVLVRTNLAPNPKLVDTSLGGYGAQTLTAVSGISDHPEGITTAVRVAYGAGAGNPGAILLPIPAVSTQYTVSVWVYNEGTTTENIAIALKGVSSGTAANTAPGSWTRLSWTMTTPASLGAGNDYGIRIGSPSASGSFLATGALIEKSPTLGTYFDGSKTASGDFTYAWAGTANASTSAQNALGVASATSSGTALVIQSSEWSSTGTKSMRLMTPPNSTYPEANLITSLATLVPGKTYTASAKMRITEIGAVPFGRSRRFNFYWSSDGGTNWTEVNGPQAPNTIGIHNVSMTFTVPANANSVILRVGGNNLNSYAFKSDVWWDEILVEEGFLVRPYFDGANPEYQNFLINPSFATATTGWGANVGFYTLSRDADVGRTALGSGKVVVNTSSTGDINTFGSRPTAKPGEVWSASAWVKASEAKTLTIQLDFRNAAGSQISSVPASVSVGTDWTRMIITATAPALTESVFVRVGSTVAQAIGFTYWVDDVVLERSPVAHDYYEGTGEFTYAWAGTANASASSQSAPAVNFAITNKSGSNLDAKFFQYQAKDEAGNPILRTVSPGGTPSSSWRVTGFGGSAYEYVSVKAGKVYTLLFTYRASGWPTNSTFATQMATAQAVNHVITNDASRSLNVSGWQTYRRTFTALRDAENTTQVYIALPTIPSATEDSIFEIGKWLLVEGEFTSPYFDGSTPSANGLTNVWNGTPNNNTSSQRGLGVDDTYAAVSQVHNYQVTENGVTFWRAYVKNPLAFGINTVSANDRPLGTYTLLFKARATGNRSIRPRVSGDQALAVNLTTEWQEFRIVIPTTGTVGYTGLVNTNPAAGWVVGDFVDVAYMACISGVYNGPFFDGTSTGPDFTYVWTGTADNSTSTQRAMVVAGTNKSNQRAETYSSSIAPFSGSSTAKSYVTALGYLPRFELSFPNPVAGRQYTAMVKMKASSGPVRLGIKWVVGTDPAPALSDSASNGNWTTVKTSAICPEGSTSMYVWMGVPDNTPIGTEFEIDQLMLVSNDYNGPFGTGDSYGWEWEGTPHASTSKGYPVGMAQLAGKPLFFGTTAGQYVLTDPDPAKNPVMASGAPRTIYTIVDGLKALPTGTLDVIWVYGIDSLNDIVANTTITMRLQSQTGSTANALLSRRTGGGGPIILDVPPIGRQIFISGMNENKTLFTAFNKSAAVSDATLEMDVAHERINIPSDTAYHKHVATYIYPGVHSPAVRQEMAKLLAHEYSIPGM